MSERFREEFTGGDGREIRAACIETETEWVLYTEEALRRGEVIRRKRDGAKAIARGSAERVPETSGMGLWRQWAGWIPGR